MHKGYSRILVDPQGDICWVTINRPEDRNSTDTVLMRELERVLKEAEKTPARAIVFSGSGDTHFIGGADGIEMMQCSPKGARAFSTRIQKLFNRMEASPLILVAAINGLCFRGVPGPRAKTLCTKAMRRLLFHGKGGQTAGRLKIELFFCRSTPPEA